MWTQLMQEAVHLLRLRFPHGLSTGISFEHRQRGGFAGIGEHLGELWKEHDQECMDLIFVAHRLLAELLAQSHQFPISDDFFGFERSQNAPPHSTTRVQWEYNPSDPFSHAILV